MAVKARPLPPVVVYNWTGCYIGVNGGWKEGRFREDVRTPAATAVIPGFTTGIPVAADSVGLDGLHADSGAVGGQVGCRWETADHWVFGVEGDADWHRWTVGRTQPVTVSPLVVGDTFDVTSRWQASFRGRVGYAWDRWMLYATGGLAITEARVGSNFPIFVGAVTFPATSAVDTKTLLGATVGGGLEYAITNNWSVGVEGRYSWYGNQTFSGGTVAAVPVVGAVPTFLFAPVTRTVRLDTVEVTGRLNYKFDWGGPVVARY
jgi:outer membrane immunogenic protein